MTSLQEKWKELKNRPPSTPPPPTPPPPRTPIKPPLKKIPGRKIPKKKDTKNKERFNRLSLTEKVKVVKKPGLSIREQRRQSEIERSGYFTDINDGINSDATPPRHNVNGKNQDTFTRRTSGAIHIKQSKQPVTKRHSEVVPNKTNSQKHAESDSEQYTQTSGLNSKKPLKRRNSEQPSGVSKGNERSRSEAKQNIRHNRAQSRLSENTSSRQNKHQVPHKDTSREGIPIRRLGENTHTGYQYPLNSQSNHYQVRHESQSPSPERQQNQFQQESVQDNPVDFECYNEQESMQGSPHHRADSSGGLYVAEGSPYMADNYDQRYDDAQYGGQHSEQYDNQNGGQYGGRPDDEDAHYNYNDSERLPPINTGNQSHRKQNHGAAGGSNSTPNLSPRKNGAVFERLYDPDFRKNRGVPLEPEPVYVREFKSRPPKGLEHVSSRHKDANYYEPRGEYVLDVPEEEHVQFKSKPPKELEHVTSRHLDPELHKRRDHAEPADDRSKTQFQANKNMSHVGSRILDPKYFQPKTQPEEQTVNYEFKARQPKGLNPVESRILDQKYFQPKPQPEEEKLENEFRAKPPKKLEHVQSRLLDQKKPRPEPEPETQSLPSFRAKIPKGMEHVNSRIMDPSFYEPKGEYSYESEDDNLDTNFKARLPSHLQHVESRIHDPKYFQKKIPPISATSGESDAQVKDFKSRPPKGLQHVQSRYYDPHYNKTLSPRFESPMVELKQKGQVVVINVKKDKDGNKMSQGYKAKMDAAKAMNGNYYNQWRQEFTEGVKDIRGDPGKKPDPKTGRVDLSKRSESAPEPEAETRRKERKPWKPPPKPKREKIDRDYFDSWVMTPTHIYKDNNDMFYKNRRNVSEMWNSLAKTIKKTVLKNGERIQSLDPAYF